MKTFQPSPGFLVGQLSRLHQGILAEKVARLGISFGQVGIVMQALCHPGCTQEQISSVLSVDKAATARALAALEKDGFVERKENPKNRRQKLVFPTPRLKGLEADLRAELGLQNELLFSGFSGEDRDAAMRLLGRMTDNCRKKQGLPLLCEIFKEFE